MLNRSSTLTEREPVLAPALGAELVHLAEELYVRLIRVGFTILLVGCGLSFWFAALERGSPGLWTSVFVGGAAALGVAGLARPTAVYLLLRSRRPLQVAPAALAAVAVLVDGPDSPCWWIALPLLWIVAAVSSTTLAIGAAIVVSLAFLTGTILGGDALVGAQDIGVLPAVVGLPLYTLVGRVLIDGFAGLVLERHHLALPAPPHEPQPLKVPNLAGGASPSAARRAHPEAAGGTRQPASRLTARQLQVTLLLSDGLRHAEIAACLGVSVGQVERLLDAARNRVGATTTSNLVAMLVRGALATSSEEEGDTSAS